MQRHPFIALCVFGAGVGLAIHGCVTRRPPVARGPGERLYRAHCAACHQLIDPARHDPPTWRHYVDTYGRRLSPQERALVLDFLSAGDPNDG